MTTAQQHSVFAGEVAPHNAQYALAATTLRLANKLQIKGAIEKMYNVNVEAINTSIVFGKTKSRNTKAGIVTGNAAKYKKAIVTLKEGEIIDFYSNI